jgi:hypothetical protein
MKKELAIHLFLFVILFLLITLLRRYFVPSYIAFWLGGVVGTVLPDIDHLIYVYYLRPHELTSQRAIYAIKRREILNTFNLLAATRNERTQLIFHSAWFQLLFLAVTFWVITSTDSIFAKGIVIAFSLHLVIDQLMDLQQNGDMNNWFSQLTFKLDREKALFFSIAMLLILLVFSLFF